MMDTDHPAGQPALHKAVLSRSVQHLSDLLDQGELIDLPDKSGNTALHLATSQGYTEAVDLLIKRHANLDLFNKSRDKPLHLALKSENEELVKKLIANGAESYSGDSDGNSPFCLALTRNLANSVEILLEKIDDLISDSNYDGHTLVHFLVLQRNASVLEKVLIKFEMTEVELDDKGRTELQSAIVTNFEPGFQLLLERCTDYLFHSDNDGHTALHLAVINGNRGMIKKLLNTIENLLSLKHLRAKVRTVFEFAVSINAQLAVGLFLEKQIHTHKQTDEPLYPLHEAVLEMNKTRLNNLLREDYDIDEKDKNGNTPLHWAIVRNFGDGVDMLLLKGANVNKQDSFGHAAVHFAILRKNLSLVDTLLIKGAEINLINKSGMKPLYLAAKEHFEEGVDILLKRGADGTGFDEHGNTVLHNAVLGGRLKESNILKMLLEINGIDIDKRNSSGYTALHMAVNEGLQSFVSLLVNKGADVNRQNSNGFTALHMAVSQNNERRRINLITSLLDNGADKELKNNSLKTSLHLAASNKYTAAVRLLLERGADVSKLDNMRNTPLHCALAGLERDGDDQTQFIDSDDETKRIVDLLIDYSSDVNCKNVNGMTPLHFAAEEGLEYIVDHLIKQGANVNDLNVLLASSLDKAVSGKVVELLLIGGVDKNRKDTSGNTALHNAVIRGFQAGVKVLLKYGADVNDANNNSETPLTLAACQSNRTILEIIIAAGADLNHRNGTGGTALHSAVVSQQYNNVELLLQHKCSLHERDSAGNTVLQHVMCREWVKGNIIIIKLLLKFGADIDTKEIDGRTVLHLATINMEEYFVKLLLDKNAKLNEQDRFGDTPLHIAVTKKYFGIVKKLLKKGADTRLINTIGFTPLHMAVRRRLVEYLDLILLSNPPIHTQNFNGDTCFHDAVSQKNIDILKKLICASPVSNLKNKHKLNATYLAASCRFQKGVCLLLECEVINFDSPDEETLLYAVVKRNTDLVKQLVDKNVDVNYKNAKSKKSALHLSVLRNFNHGVEALMNAGAHVNDTDSMGNTPLHLAAIVKSVTIMSTLLDRAAKVHAQNEDGRTALHWAALVDFKEGVELLLEQGALLDHQDCDGNTPLHLAFSRRSYDAIVSLLEAGARRDIDNREGNLCYSMCRTNVYSCEVHGLLELLKQDFAKWNEIGSFYKPTSYYNHNIEVYLNKMKSTSFNGNTLLNLLVDSKDPHFVTNLNLKKILKSAQLESDLPNYASILRARFRRAKRRYGRLNLASRLPLQVEDGNGKVVQLPAEIMRQIMSELSDEDLFHALNAFNLGH